MSLAAVRKCRAGLAGCHAACTWGTGRAAGFLFGYKLPLGERDGVFFAEGIIFRPGLSYGLRRSFLSRCEGRRLGRGGVRGGHAGFYRISGEFPAILLCSLRPPVSGGGALRRDGLVPLLGISGDFGSSYGRDQELG